MDFGPTLLTLLSKKVHIIKNKKFKKIILKIIKNHKHVLF